MQSGMYRWQDKIKYAAFAFNKYKCANVAQKHSNIGFITNNICMPWESVCVRSMLLSTSDFQFKLSSVLATKHIVFYKTNVYCEAK